MREEENKPAVLLASLGFTKKGQLPLKKNRRICFKVVYSANRATHHTACPQIAMMEVA